MAERRPAGYPKLKNYKPSRFMLPTSHYDKAKADRAVKFIENLCHTKGKWAGKRFWLLPWQEQLIRDIFGIVKPDGNRQFRTAFVEICKKVGMTSAVFSRYRDRLIKRGIIISSGHGYISLLLPRFEIVAKTYE